MGLNLWLILLPPLPSEIRLTYVYTQYTMVKYHAVHTHIYKYFLPSAGVSRHFYPLSPNNTSMSSSTMVLLLGGNSEGISGALSII